VVGSAQKNPISRVNWFARTGSLFKTTQPAIAGKLCPSICNAGQSIDSRPALGATASPATLIARLFVILPAAHFLLNAGVFNQFAKSFDSIVYRLVVTQTQLDHKFLPLDQSTQLQPYKSADRHGFGNRQA